MSVAEGMFLAQYKVLRENGHSPSEAFNETVEEATQSLFPLIGQYGMDYMYNACSTTARRGALDWAPKFEAVCFIPSLFLRSNYLIDIPHSLYRPTSPSSRPSTRLSVTELRLADPLNSVSLACLPPCDLFTSY